MQNDIEYYKGHLRHLQTLNDCLRKDLDDLRRQNSTLKWKKCDLEREIVRLNSTAECLRQRVCLMSPFRGLSVCLSRSCIMLKRQKISISYGYDSPMFLRDRVKICLTSFSPFLPKFCHIVLHPCGFERSRHLMAKICGRTVRDIAMVAIENL